MVHKIHIADSALQDMAAIADYYIREASAATAFEIIDGLEAAIEQLKELPGRGHGVPELERIHIRWFKEIHYKIYRILYELDGTTVFVHAVLDGRRDIQDILSQRNLR